MKRNRRKGRKKRGGKILSFLLVLVIIGVIIASVTMFFQTNEIVVTGVQKHTVEEIVEASGLSVGDNLFAVNKFEVEKRIKDAYPYVGSVEIRRRLPDTFLLNVTERTPVAYLDVGEQRWLLDKQAYLLEPLSISDAVSYLKIVSESEAIDPKSGAQLELAEEGVSDGLAAVMTCLSDVGLIDRVGQVDVTKLYQLNFLYENRLLVQLGNSEKLERKISLFKTILDELEPTDRGVLNVSEPPEGRFQPNSSVGAGG